MLPAILGNITKSMLAYPLDMWKPQKPTTTVGYNNLSSSNIDMNYYSKNYLTGSSSSSQQHQQQKQQRLLQIYVYETIQPPELNHVHSCGIEEILNLESPSQYNFFSDLALLNLFLTYPGRTYDPKTADIFVVPYPHSTHCMLTDCRPQYNATHGVHCSQISGETIKQLLKSLKYKTSGQGQWERHLFLLSADSGLLKPMLEKMPLILTLGYRQDFPNDKRYNPRKLTCGQIIVPYLNDHPSFQPSIIYSRNDDAWWTTRPRKYSFVYIYGGSNKKTRGDVETDTRRYRRHFADSVSRRRRSSNRTSNVTSLLIGGLPYILEELPSSSNNKNNATSHSGGPRRSPEQIYELYQESILCPCLPGDSPIQKRFFDAIINGCLPVVLKFPPTRRGSLHNEIYWHPWQVDIRRVYPYSAPPASHSPVNKTATIAKQGRRATEEDAATEVVGNNKNNNNNNTAILIDYESFVIQVDVPVNNGTIETAMEAILSNPTELRRRQLLMKKYAPLFTYGMGPNAHRYEDAFAQILKLLQSHVDRL